MKKTIKMISMFLFAFGIFFMLQINNGEIIKGINITNGYGCASGGTCKNNSNNDEINANKTYGYTNTVTISPNGDVIVTYTRGFTEALITYEKCINYMDTPTNVENSENKRICKQDGFSVDKIVAYSGAVNTKDVPASKTFSASKYYAPNEIVRVSVILQFMSGENTNDSYNGEYFPLFCNSNLSIPNCDKGSRGDVTKLKLSLRAENYKEDLGLTNATIEMGDTLQTIYAGNVSKNSYNKTFVFANVVVVVDTTDDSNVSVMIKDIVMPTLLAILGVLALVTSVTLGYQIVKSADEPEVRSEKIKKLRNILIGIAAVAVVLLAYDPVYNFVKDLINKQQSGQ